MTYTIIAATLAVWVFVQDAGLDPRVLATSVCNLGLVPGEVTHAAVAGTSVPLGDGLACVVGSEPVNVFTPLTSMFLHGSWMHILGNLWFFWVFGNNIEDSVGRLRFLVFYLICGLVAAAVHVAVNPTSPVPTVGASGAISGVMGAYLLLYPRVRVRMLFIFIIFFKIFRVPAWAVLLWWFMWQVISGLPELGTMRPDVSGGVAVWAHVGGFVCGVLLIRLFLDENLHRRRLALSNASGVVNPPVGL